MSLWRELESYVVSRWQAHVCRMLSYNLPRSWRSYFLALWKNGNFLHHSSATACALSLSLSPTPQSYWIRRANVPCLSLQNQWKSSKNYPQDGWKDQESILLLKKHPGKRKTKKTPEKYTKFHFTPNRAMCVYLILQYGLRRACDNFDMFNRDLL